MAPPAPPPVAAAPPPERARLDLFDDLAEVPAEAAPAPAAAPAAPPPAPPPAAGAAPSRYVPPPVERKIAWPAGVPGAEEAERMLLDALDGLLAAEAPLRPVVEHALAGLSELERSVLTGAPVPLDPEPIRRAAVIRLRVGAAIASAPGPGAEVDGAAIEALLGELDGLLSQVNALLAQAPEPLRPTLEAIRNMLVKEAVDFAEATHTTAAADVAPAPTGEARPPRPGGARVISVHGGEAVEQEAREGRRGKVVGALLLLVVLAAGAIHGMRWYQRQEAVARFPTLRGAPEGMLVLPGPPGSPRIIVPGKRPPDRAQVEQFKAEQARLGNVVAEEKGGVLVVTPQATGRPTGDGRQP